MMLPRPRRASAGFTLVEMLLAVTLMALLLALAYGGLSAATRASARGQVMLEQTERLRMAHQFVRRELNQMLPLPYGLDDQDQLSVLFEGGGDFAQFVAPMPGYLGAGGPQVQRFELLQGDNGLQLVFTHALWQGFDPSMLSEQEPVVLLDGLQNGQFEFLGRDENGQPGGWTPGWTDPTSLPMAVRINLGMPEGSRIVWPELTTGVRIDPMAISHVGIKRDYANPIQEMIQRSRDRQDGGDTGE